MGFEKFRENVIRKVRKKAAGELDIRLNTVIKNNGVRLSGLIATVKGSNGGPCIYLDDYYGKYINEGMKPDEAADEIYGQLIEHRNDMQDIDLSCFLNWETARGSIRAKLVNAAQNGEQLEKIPHRLFLDMAVAYYAVIGGTAVQGIGTILIRNEHMEMWGQDEESIYQAAMSNMRLDGAPCFGSIETVMEKILPGAASAAGTGHLPDMGMYILTNGSMCYGASEILDKNTLHSIADRIGDGFIVLPSSVHEVIVLKADDAAEYGKLANMVREVNTTQVTVEERLSDHVYAYSRSEDALKVVA